MLKLWLIVALMTPACRDKVALTPPENTKNNKDSVYFTNTQPYIHIEFNDKDLQVAFPIAYGTNGAVAGIFSRESPKFEVKGNVECYDVQVEPLSLEGKLKQTDSR